MLIYLYHSINTIASWQSLSEQLLAAILRAVARPCYYNKLPALRYLSGFTQYILFIEHQQLTVSSVYSWDSRTIELKTLHYSRVISKFENNAGIKFSRFRRLLNCDCLVTADVNGEQRTIYHHGMSLSKQQTDDSVLLCHGTQQDHKGYAVQMVYVTKLQQPKLCITYILVSLTLAPSRCSKLATKQHLKKKQRGDQEGRNTRTRQAREHLK